MGSLKERQKIVYCLFIQQSGKFKKKTKSCLLFVYPAGLGSLKRKAKGCLLFAYPAGWEV